MSNGGFFLVYRQVWEHSMFKDEPLTKREAWLWLISEAAYSGTTRGSVVASYRDLAKQWQWPTSRVFRFLDRLRKADMIKTASKSGDETTCGTKTETTCGLLKDRRSMVVTICNYSKYQIRVANSPTAKTAKVERSLEQLSDHTLKKELSSLRSDISKKETASDFSNSSKGKKSNLGLRATADDLDAKIAADRTAALERWERRKAEQAAHDAELDALAERLRLERIARQSKSGHAQRVLDDLKRRHETEH